MKKGPTVERRPLQWHEAELCQADAFQVAHQVDYKTHPTVMKRQTMQVKFIICTIL